MQFFPLAIAAVCWFVAKEGDATTPSRMRVRLAGFGAWGNLLAIFVASFIHSSWLAHAICVTALLFWMLGKFGNLSITRMLGICGLLLITVPFPFNGDHELVRMLQRISALACSCMMDAMNILHVRMGNILEITDKQLLVEEACSGVDSQYALMAVAGVLLLIGRASLWVSIATIVTVPIWAILGNILRIFSIVLGAEYLGIDLSTGWQHTLLGLVAFALAAWAHWSSVQFLNWIEWTVCTPSTALISTAPELLRTTTSTVPNVSRVGISVACIALLFAPIGWVYVSGSIFRNSLPLLDENLIASLPGEQSRLPKLLSPRKVGFDTKLRERGHMDGQCSRAWRVSSVHGLQLMSIDLPFRGAHPLWVCYSNTGWNLTSEQMVDMYSEKLARNWPVHEIVMRGPEGQWATLHFVHIDLSGQPVGNKSLQLVDAIDDQEGLAQWQDKFLKVLREKFVLVSSKQYLDPITVQFQFLTQESEIPNPDRIAESRKQFQVCREEFLEEIQPVLNQMRSRFD